jgi:MFS family permease
MWGKVYKFWDLKWVYLLSIGIFEVGSLICAVAPNSPALIAGRAITGWGAAGVLAGCYIIVAFAVPPSRRPAFTGILGATYGAASIVGPLIGGGEFFHQSFDSGHEFDLCCSLHRLCLMALVVSRYSLLFKLCQVLADATTASTSIYLSEASQLQLSSLSSALPRQQSQPMAPISVRRYSKWTSSALPPLWSPSCFWFLLCNGEV